MITICILSYIIPVIICLFIGWLVLPKGATLGGLIRLFNSSGPDFIPPSIVVVFIPVLNIPISAIMILWGTFSHLEDILTNSKIRIK